MQHADAQSLYTLANLEYRMGNFTEAIQAGLKGELVPDSDSLSARFYGLLAKSHHKLGNAKKQTCIAQNSVSPWNWT